MFRIRPVAFFTLFFAVPSFLVFPLSCFQVMMPPGDWFLDGNIFMKSGVHLEGW